MLRTMASGPHLTVNPEGQLLVDDKLELKICGLGRHQKATVHAVINEAGAMFESCCCYTADENGEVNLATQPSQAGSYTGEPRRGVVEVGFGLWLTQLKLFCRTTNY